MSMFLKIDGVEGDSTVKGFEKQIEVNSFSFSTSQSVSPIRSTSAHTSGRPNLSLLNFSKNCDASSPILCKKLWTGATLTNAVFTACRDEGGKLIAFLTFTLEKVVIANLNISGGGGLANENLSLNYAKIEFNYIPQKHEGGTSGNIMASYNLEEETGAA